MGQNNAHATRKEVCQFGHPDFQCHSRDHESPDGGHFRRLYRHRGRQDRLHRAKAPRRSAQGHCRRHRHGGHSRPHQLPHPSGDRRPAVLHRRSGQHRSPSGAAAKGSEDGLPQRQGGGVSRHCRVPALRRHLRFRPVLLPQRHRRSRGGVRHQGQSGAVQLPLHRRKRGL